MPFDDCRVAGDKDMILGMLRSIQLTMRPDKGMTADGHETDISPKFHETRLGFCR